VPRCGALRQIIGSGDWRAPKHAATRLPPAGAPEAHAEFFCRRRQRYKHAPVVECPPKSYGQRLELVEGSSARGLIYHCADTDKAGYMYSSTLHIFRVVYLLLRQRRGAGPGELQLARGRSKYFATAPAHTQRALNGTETREVGVVKSLNFPVRDTRARATGISCFSCQTSTRSFLRFSAPPRSFSPACSKPPGCFFG
jgi:hypothetical protein